jgi:hypothetical protein
MAIQLQERRPETSERQRSAPSSLLERCTEKPKLDSGYDIFLAGVFELEGQMNQRELDFRTAFYDELSNKIRALKKTIFVPHQHLDPKTPSQEVYSICSDIILSSSLVLCDLGIESTGTGVLHEIARANSKPIIAFTEEHRLVYFRNSHSTENYQTLIGFSSQSEAFERIVLNVRKFYNL